MNEALVTAETIGRLPKRQLEAFSLICINQDGGHHPATLEALMRRGLIEEIEQRVPGGVVYRYEATLPAHIAWAEWCSQQPDEEEGDGA